MSKKEIWRRRINLDLARREYSMDAMKEYDNNYYYPAIRALAEECEQDGGHDWMFYDLNPVGYPIFTCNVCGTTKIEVEG